MSIYHFGAEWGEDRTRYSSPKILVIGQAPPAKEQKVPYDTTMLYDWFLECGITKEQAQEIFDFDAIYNKFPGYDENGGHKIPTEEQMNEYWPVLEKKLSKASKVLVLGNAPKEYLSKKRFFVRPASKVLYLMHPSRRNFGYYQRTKKELLTKLKNFIT